MLMIDIIKALYYRNLARKWERIGWEKMRDQNRILETYQAFSIRDGYNRSAVDLLKRHFSID